MPSDSLPNSSNGSGDDFTEGYRPLEFGEFPLPGDEFSASENPPGEGFVPYAGYFMFAPEDVTFRWRTNRPPTGSQPQVERFLLVDRSGFADNTLVEVTEGGEYTRLHADFYPRGTAVIDGTTHRRRRAARNIDVVLDCNAREILREHSVTIDNRVYHQSDPRVFVCPECAEFERRDLARDVYGRDPICRNCAEQSEYYSCDDCGILVHEDYQHDHDGDTLCPRCHRNREGSQPQWGRLLSYSDKSICGVKPKEPKKQLFGLEVECHVLDHQSIDEAIRLLHTKLGPGYYVTKSDGSLVHGFEIVTRPDSMDIHRGEWVRTFNAIAETSWLRQHLRSWAAPQRCCGIHIHIDKRTLSQMQLGKMLVFLNDPTTRKFIEKVAGRGANSYTKFEDGKKVIEGKKLKSGRSPCRYVALNVGDNTAEMRIFRGTLNPESFFKNLDFAEALVEWTGLANGCSLADAANPEAFCKFVHKNAHRWTHLNNKLLSWGF